METPNSALLTDAYPRRSALSTVRQNANVRLHMATAARVFGILIAIAGIAYCGMAVYFFFNIEHTATVLDWAKATEHEAFGHRTIGEWKQGAWFNASVFFAVGFAAAICGMGIARRREWARRTWLIASVLFVLLVIAVAVSSGGEWLHYGDLLVFALPSFVLLYRRFSNANRAI
jgi:hypothetical protein